MTPQQIIAIGIRLVATFLAFFSLRYLFALPASMASNNLAAQAYIAYITGGAALVLAAALWFFPMAIAHRIVPRTSHGNVVKLQAIEAARVGCALIGLWFLVSVLPAFVWFFFSRLASPGTGSLYGLLTPAERFEFWFYLAEIALAMFLIFGSSVFARLALRSENGETHDRAL